MEQIWYSKDDRKTPKKYINIYAMENQKQEYQGYKENNYMSEK